MDSMESVSVRKKARYEVLTEQPSSSTTPSSGEPAACAEKVLNVESVSVRKKGTYEAHDKVDQYLLLQVCRHVQTDTLELLAEYLGVSQEQYVDTRTTQPATPRAQILKVCTKETKETSIY